MYADADVLYSQLKPEDWLKGVAENALKGEEMKTSALTVVELEIVGKRDFGLAFSNNVWKKLDSMENLSILSLDNAVLERAVEIRKEHGLNIFDSVHAATALQEGESILSTDRMFDLVSGLERKDPRAS